MRKPSLNSQNISPNLSNKKTLIDNDEVVSEIESTETKGDESMIEKEALTKYDDLEVFFSKDPKYLDQYYKLRHSVFNGEYGWKEYDGSENRFDREGKVIVAVVDGEVIGGMRLMFSDCSNFLSNEVPGTQYEYRKLIQKYDDREGLIFSEISSLVVKKEYRKSDVATTMMEKLFKESERYGCHYIFAVAVAVVCRNDRRTAKRFGYDVEIVMQYPWKEKKMFDYVKSFPMYTKLR